MIEALGLASMTEIPLVLVDVQRAGPATGMPTKTAQGDLYLALYAGNDDAPRFVIAPSSVEDCFYQIINAFNLAERYQMPVVVLSDQALAPRVETCSRFRLDEVKVVERETPDIDGDDAYQRYKITETGVSPMAIPGTKGGHYTSEGLEHNELGNPNYTPQMHQAMMEKRRRKVDTARQQLTLWPNVVEEWGDDDAAIAIMGWGSALGPVQEAMARAQAAGHKVAALFPKVLLPMPDLQIRRFMRGRRAIIIPELNQRGQFARVIEHRYSHELIRDNIEVVSLTKYQGLPFRPVEIFDKIVEVAQMLTVRASED
jgi:2-oxoglutarate ferredoxin oxidoreductase subunit alpha